MAKRKTKNRFRGLDPMLTDNQKAINRLDKVAKRIADAKDRAFAFSLLAQYNRLGCLSDKQWWWVYKLPKRELHSPPVGQYCVYGIKAGEELKIGVSSNPDKRARTLQIGNAEKVKVVWIYRASTKKRAFALEKKLHRHCNEFHIRGEWFRQEALQKLQLWRNANATAEF